MKEIKLENSSQENYVVKKDAKYWFSLSVLLVIIVTFIIGQGLSSRYHSESFSFGSYDGQSINYSENSLLDVSKDEAYYELISMYANIFGYENAKRFIDSQMYQIWRSGFDKAVEKLAYFSFLKKNSADVSVKQVNSQLVSNPMFLDDTGRFSVKKYKSIPSANVATLQDTYSKRIAQNQVISDLQNYNYTEPDLTFVAEMSKDKRVLEFVKFDYSKYPESEAINFAQANKDIFRKISIATITLETQKDAQEINKKLQAGEDFSDLAKNFSKDSWADKNGNRGQNYQYALKTWFSDEDISKIFSLTKDKTVDVKDKDGKNFVIVKAITDIEDYSGDDMKDIVAYIIENEKSIVEKYFIQKADEFIANVNQTPFEDYTQSLGMELFKTNAFPINYNGEDIFESVSLDGQGSVDFSSVNKNEDFFINIFKMQKGDISKPISLENFIIVASLKDIVNEDVENSKFEDKYLRMLNNSIETGANEYVIDKAKIRDNFENAYKTHIGGTHTGGTHTGGTHTGGHGK